MLRGLQLSTMRAIPHYGIMFGVYHQLSQMLVNKKPGQLLTIQSLFGVDVSGTLRHFPAHFAFTLSRL